MSQLTLLQDVISSSTTARDELKSSASESAAFSGLVLSKVPGLKLERFSTLLKLCRIVAWINRFVTNARQLN